jgi:hypothetical protein
MIVVMKIQEWELEQKGPLYCPLPIKVDSGKMIGYLPVYGTIEDAKVDFPDGPFQEIRRIEHENTRG